jgi:hypothetical protein
MKLKHLYVLVATVLLWTLYNSNSTGAGSANFNCSNCHNGSTTTTKIDSVILRDVANLEKMVKYSPSTPYIITIYGSNSGSLNRFGFQMSHGGKGSFSNPSTDCQLSGNIWEHKQKISGSSGKFQVSARWNAPAKGTGTVTLEAYLNAVDNDNSTSGDKPSSKFTYAFSELTSADSASVEVRQMGSNDPKNPSSSITYQAFPTNGGTAPEYQWRINSQNLGGRTTEDMITSATFKGGDTISCWMFSNKFGALPIPAKSNRILVNKNGSSIQNSKEIIQIYQKNQTLYILGVSLEKIDIQVIELSGKIKLHRENIGEIGINMSDWVKGIYFIKVQLGNEIKSKKVIIE